MKINVTENKVYIKEEQILNENEYNIHKIQFDFSSEYTDDLVKVALFSIDNHTYKKIISNNECDIPSEVLTQRGYSILGVYAYKTEQDTLVLRYSPSPTKISVYDGSYKADAENSEPITPSEIEQYQQILQNSLQQFQNQYNALVEEAEGDIQAIEDELQRKVDEGYFDGEDGFSPIANVIQLSNGVKIEIEDKNGKTTADVLNGVDGKDGENGQDGQDGYTPQRGIDYWTEEDKQEVEEEATQQIKGKIEEYNENATEKLNQYNQNSVQKTNDYNTNAEQKMSAYNTNANQKVESFNTNANSKLSEYNSNAETKKTAYDENATQKTNSFNTNATNKLTEYNTNHTEKMSAYNSNSIQKLNAFNENATQKTEDFDEHTEEIQDKYNRLKATLPTTGEVTGQAITLNKTAELEFKKPPLPMGNSEQEGEPSPDNEVPITNVTGDVEVVVENKNLAWNGWAEDFVRRINSATRAIITELDNRNCLDYLASAGWKDYDNKYIFKTNFKENTQYTFMFDMFTNIHSGNICIEYTDGTTSGIRNLSTTAWNNVKMVSSPNKTIKYLRASYESGNSWIDLDTFMVYEGTEQIDFIPHKEQKFTFPLGNEKLMLGDYLADDGIHHVRGQMVLNGSENWQDADASSVGYSKKFLGIINEFKMRTEIICTHFKNLTTIADTNNTSIIGKAGVSYWGNNHIYFGVEKQTTEEWKAWLAEQYENEKPVILEYIRPEEVIVPYTSAQQTAYNQIKQSLSYEGQTNISSNQNAIFNVEAYLDTKEVLDNKVDKVTGKGLSTNDFTNTYKNNVDSNTSARHTHANKIVLDGIATSDITNWNGKQNETDNSLNTTNKTITGAINEVYSIARGANQAVSYSNYQAMITAFNALANDVYNVGQNVMIVTLQVPDLWISGIESTSVPYTYTTDEAFTTALSTNGYVQVGYYKLSALETQKVDLTDYATKTYVNNLFNSIVDGDEVSY